MFIKLNKKDLNGGTIALSPSYISDGTWAIKLDVVENAALLRTEESIRAFADIANFREMPDESMEKVFPKKRTMKITSAGRILNSSVDLDPRSDRVVFTDGKQDVLFNRAYVKLLGLANLELSGEFSTGPFTDEDRTRVLMPMRS